MSGITYFDRIRLKITDFDAIKTVSVPYVNDN